MTMQYGVLAARVEQKQERLTMVHGKWCDKGEGRRAKGEGRRAPRRGRPIHWRIASMLLSGVAQVAGTKLSSPLSARPFSLECGLVKNALHPFG